MGHYINKDSKGNNLPAFRKTEKLIDDGAMIVPAIFQENLICVVDNGMFEAAAYMFSEQEFNYFLNDKRRKAFLVHPKAKELAIY